MTVVVFGSINMDLVVQSPRLPRKGETLTGTAFFTAAGGKGANQAVAAARLGAPTCMIGRVGDDVFGVALLAGLRADGVDSSGVAVTPGPSGVALITVDRAGENTIVVVPGANGALDDDDLDRLDRALDGARVLLLQLEAPLTAVIEAAQLARRRGVTVILDPAPAQQLPDELYPQIDIITPNETETAALVGIAPATEALAAQAAALLLARGAGCAIIKRSDKGVYVANAQQQFQLAPFAVRAVDTVAAGDAFNGGLAAALAAHRPLAEAARWGAAAGAIAVTRAGAQPALPTRAEVLALLDSNA